MSASPIGGLGDDFWGPPASGLRLVDSELVGVLSLLEVCGLLAVWWRLLTASPIVSTLAPPLGDFGGDFRSLRPLFDLADTTDTLDLFVMALVEGPPEHEYRD